MSGSGKPDSKKSDSKKTDSMQSGGDANKDAEASKADRSTTRSSSTDVESLVGLHAEGDETRRDSKKDERKDTMPSGFDAEVEEFESMKVRRKKLVRTTEILTMHGVVVDKLIKKAREDLVRFFKDFFMRKCHYIYI